MAHLNSIKALGLGALLGFGNASNATVLTFDIDGLNAGNAVPQEYGDRVTSAIEGDFSYGTGGGPTPNVVVEYAGSSVDDLSYWTTGYNDLENVIYYEPDGAAGFTITFTADPGYMVSLSGFDVGNFGTSVTLPSISISDGVMDLFAQADIVLPATSFTHTSFDFSPFTASQLILQVDITGLGGNSDNIGLDNIEFSQVVVPVPAAVWMFGSALLGLMGIRRRPS